MLGVVEVGRLLDAVVRTSFESENASIPPDVLEQYEVDEWEHLNQVVAFLGPSDHMTMQVLKAQHEQLVQPGLVVQDDSESR